jgi:hypothetical protein
VRRNTPAGGKYTRPRRGYRTRSHYRERLAKRGLTSKTVRTESLDTLRKRQENYVQSDTRVRGVPSAPYVPADAERKRGGKAHIG